MGSIETGSRTIWNSTASSSSDRTSTSLDTHQGQRSTDWFRTCERSLALHKVGSSLWRIYTSHTQVFFVLAFYTLSDNPDLIIATCRQRRP